MSSLTPEELEAIRATWKDVREFGGDWRDVRESKTEGALVRAVTDLHQLLGHIDHLESEYRRRAERPNPGEWHDGYRWAMQEAADMMCEGDTTIESAHTGDDGDPEEGAA